MNLDASNLSHHLAKETIARYPDQWNNFLEVPTLKHAFGYDIRKSRQKELRKKNDYWVDYSHIEDKPNFLIGIGWSYREPFTTMSDK